MADKSQKIQKFKSKQYVSQKKVTPYIIYAQIGFSTNRQKFNNNIATAEKSPIFTSHKLYTNTL